MSFQPLTLSTFESTLNTLSESEFQSFWHQTLQSLQKKTCLDILLNYFQTHVHGATDNLSILTNIAKSVKTSKPSSSPFIDVYPQEDDEKSNIGTHAQSILVTNCNNEASPLQTWLSDIKMDHFYHQLHSNGYTFQSMQQLAEKRTLSANDFKLILGENVRFMDRLKIASEANKLTDPEISEKYCNNGYIGGKSRNGYNKTGLFLWLEDNELQRYYPQFRKYGYTLEHLAGNKMTANDFGFIGKGVKFMDQLKLAAAANKLDNETLMHYKDLVDISNMRMDNNDNNTDAPPAYHAVIGMVGGGGVDDADDDKMSLI